MSVSHLRRRGWIAADGGGAVRREAGETLLEVMFSIMLMAVAFTAILGGMFAAATTAKQSRDKTRASIALQAYAESILQPVGFTRPYRPCALTTDSSTTDTSLNRPSQYGSFESYPLNAPPGTLPTGWEAKISRVVYLQKPVTGSFPYPSGPPTADPLIDMTGGGYNQYQATETCSNQMNRSVSPERDGGIQRITITIYKPDGGGAGGMLPVDALTVTKRDQRCSDAPANADYVDQGPC